MQINKYINIKEINNRALSRTAESLLLPLMLLSNKDNEIKVPNFMKYVKGISDKRTWNKYLKELEKAGIIIYLNKNIIMVSPYNWYADGISKKFLINKWNEARNAIN